MNNIWILAQGAADQNTARVTSEPVTSENQKTVAVVASDANAPAAKAPAPKPQWMQFLPLVLLVVVMVLVFRGPQKRQQQHRKMIASLEKNDKVRTIGGIIGTVVDIRDDEITLKIDEATNTKIKIAVSAIGKNLSKEKN